ncbi:MAG TPA: Fe-S cluster assembly protein SufD, partial [Acidimicrobiia bacterium]|nr:Fe-S cluster assembly protein SufD [Acidimicrobiia bacterium]
GPPGVLSIDRTTHERVTAALPAAQRPRATAGWDAFAAMAMPSEKEENWRYVHPGVTLAEYSLAEAPGSPLTATLGMTGVAGAVSVDGHTVAARSGEGVAVSGWSDTVAAGQPVDAGDLFEALHEAFAGDGIVVEVAKGSRPSEPVMIDLQAVTPGVAALPRLRIVAGATSEVAVVVHQRSPDGLAALVVPRFEIEAGSGARVFLTVIQDWGDATAAMARHHYVAGRDSTVGLAEAGIGGRYSRLHLTVDLVGDGAAAQVVGAYFGDGSQTMDYRYFLRHAARSTTSEMFLKGAVAGESRSVFSGLIRIEPEGQKTNAHQTNRNLVLSDQAEAHSVPNLEILADDVRCGHGSAVGPLDEEQRYYLMSRGLDRSRSDRLQVKGFFEEALLRFPDRRFEPMLRDRMMNKYSRVAS